ncbi:MAG: hypothetical protein ACP5VR_03120 [Acidimicrobiales bacterium]
MAAPPGRESQPVPPLVPLTRRAELAQGNGARRSRAPAQGAAGREMASDELYVLASERSGQPEPPTRLAAEPHVDDNEQLAARVVIGLSRV